MPRGRRLLCCKTIASFCDILRWMSVWFISAPLNRRFMDRRPARLLCTGNEADLLQSRCAVLRHGGYEAQAASLTDAEILLHKEKYDLVIISACLSEWEKGRILSALLAQVEQRLPPVSHSASSED